MESIHIKSQLSLDDYRNYFFSLVYGKPIGIVFTIIGIFLWATLFYYFMINNSIYNKFPIVPLIMALLLTALPVFMYFRAQSSFKNSTLSESIDYKLDRTGFQSKGESFELDMKWGDIGSIIEKEKYFLFKIGKSTAFILSKNEIPSKDLFSLRELFKAIPNIESKIQD